MNIWVVLWKPQQTFCCRKCLKNINNQLLPPLHSVRLKPQYVHHYETNVKGGRKGLIENRPRTLEQLTRHLLR